MEAVMVGNTAELIVLREQTRSYMLLLKAAVLNCNSKYLFLCVNVRTQVEKNPFSVWQTK